MSNYEPLKAELISIAKLIENYPDALKPRVFDLLIAEYLGAPKTKIFAEKEKEPAFDSENGTPASSGKQVGARKKKASQESYSLDKNLNLRGGGSVPSFSSFVSEKQPKTASDFNAVATYYLIKIAGAKEATMDQIYTCYAEVKKKPADHFKQSLIDTKNKKGYIDFTESGTVTLPHRGVVFVEHDLPAAEKPKAKK